MLLDYFVNCWNETGVYERFPKTKSESVMITAKERREEAKRRRKIFNSVDISMFLC